MAGNDNALFPVKSSNLSKAKIIMLKERDEATFV